MKNLIALLFLFALTTSAIYAKNYIAAVTGSSGGTGSLVSPCDIPTAISKAIAGDTVYIRGGHYMMMSQVSLSKGGNSTAYINIWAYPGDERPVLDFYNRGYSGTNAASERGVAITKDYYSVRGLDITRAGDNGLHIQGSYNKIEQCRFYKNCDAGLQITGGTGSYNEIIDCDAFRNFDYKTKNSDGTSDAGGNADGFACKLTVGVGNKFIRCRSWDNSDDAYDCYGTQNDIYFEDSWAMTNGLKSYDVTDYPGGTTGSVTNLGNGNGFKVGGNASPGGASLIRCISIGHKIMSNSNKGFDQNNGVGRVLCYNCISYGDGRGYVFPNNTDSRGAHVFANNISLNSGSNSFHSTTIHKTNTWNGFTVSAADFESTVVENSKADRNADGSLPYMGGLFRLVRSSGLIDKGSDVSLPYMGKAPDLGPFENSITSSVGKIDAEAPIDAYYSVESRNLVIRGPISAFEIFNINGQKTYQQAILESAFCIDVRSWMKGLYLLRGIDKQDQLFVKKILIL